ncbi:MAG: sporulation transcriptional regulator SpoIIID, partial [Oscillospiraceae bacterium]|nr:sporulation transcriptional regulator SpoIIID [Oscillospiraceae bacterium]
MFRRLGSVLLHIIKKSSFDKDNFKATVRAAAKQFGISKSTV